MRTFTVLINGCVTDRAYKAMGKYDVINELFGAEGKFADIDCVIEDNVNGLCCRVGGHTVQVLAAPTK